MSQSTIAGYSTFTKAHIILPNVLSENLKTLFTFHASVGDLTQNMGATYLILARRYEGARIVHSGGGEFHHHGRACAHLSLTARPWYIDNDVQCVSEL